MDHLDYYKKINSIPTVDTSDLKKNELINQRFNFFFKIGITKNELQNKNILELCAGTGYNAEYLITKCSIKKIKLIDKNPSSIKALKKNIAKFKSAKIIISDIFKYKTNEKFDYTILENAIGGFSKKNSIKIFNQLNKFTKKNGTIILNFPNLYGMFSLKLKFLYAVLLVKQNKILSFDDKLNFLTKIFQPHLNYLSKNARKCRKWVLDVILNHEYITKTQYFDYFELKKNLRNNLIIRSTAPNFYEDYIWYKNMKIKEYNTNVFNQLLDKQINFIDFETRFSYCKNISLNINKIIKLISKINFDDKINKKDLNIIQLEIQIISKRLNKSSHNNKVSLAMNELIKIIAEFKTDKKIKIKTKNFYKLWGIGTSAVSLYKI